MFDLAVATFLFFWFSFFLWAGSRGYLGESVFRVLYDLRYRRTKDE